MPLSVWLLNEQTEVGIFEAGISQPGEMFALRDIIQPTIGVFTSLGTAHQENFRSMEEKCMEKLELMHDTEAMVYCSDNDTVSRCIRRMQYKGEKIAWSQCDEQAALFVKSTTSLPHSTRITYIWKDEENCFEKYLQKTGERSRWTNALFGGMPTYQMAPSYGSTNLLTKVVNAYHLWLPENVWYVFAYLLGFYILLRAFDFRQHLAALGSIIWAFSTYFLIIIAAGHIWKVWA